MKRALWKAKSLDKNEFVYGYYFRIWDKHYVLWGTSNEVPNQIEVDPSTLCQCSGIPDADENLIFEGDWWTENFGGWADSYMVVQYDEEKAAFVALEYAGVSPENHDSSDWEVRLLDEYHTIRIKGNIHDRKE